MTREAETLTDLVAARVGDGAQLMTYRAFAQAAVDPGSGYRPSRATLWKIRNGEPIKMDPRIVGAVAAGLGVALERAQAAAAYQYTGFLPAVVGGGGAVSEVGSEPGERAQKTIEQWDAEEGNPPGDS